MCEQLHSIFKKLYYHVFYAKQMFISARVDLGLFIQRVLKFH